MQTIKKINVNNNNKEMSTIKSELQMVTAESHLCHPQGPTRLHLSSQKRRSLSELLLEETAN